MNDLFIPPSDTAATAEKTTLPLSRIRIDGGTQSRSSVYQNVVDDYASAIEDGSKFPPVVVFFDGENYWLADGFHRHSAYSNLGIDYVDAEIRQGTRRDAILHSVGANAVHGLRRTNEDKRRAVMTLLGDEEWARWSDNQIAKQCGVSQPFVGALRASSYNRYKMPAERLVERNGVTYTQDTSNIGKSAESSPGLLVIPASAQPAITRYDETQATEILKAAREIADSSPEIAKEYFPAPTAIEEQKRDTIATKFTGDQESYTPAKYTDAARRVMGSINVDPASNPIAQETVKADHWYDLETNGLEQQWLGTVFLNPPYSYPEIAHFIDKLCQHVNLGDVTAAVLLTNNSADTKWFRQAALMSSAICLTTGRINFYKADGSITQPTNGQSFFYFGGDPEGFAKEFSEFGLIVTVMKGVNDGNL